MNTTFSIFSPALFPPPDRSPTTVIANRIDWLSASAACVVSLLLPPGILRQSLVIPTIVYLFYRVRQTSLPVGYHDSYLTYIHLLWTLIRWVDFTMLHSPEKDIYRTSEPDGSRIETPQDVRSYPLHHKLWRNINLVTNLRGIGWNWRVRNILLVDASTTRLSACLTHLLLILKYAIICDSRDYLVEHTTLLNPQTTTSYFSLPLLNQLIYVWMGILNSAAGLAIGYHIPALIVIALHLSIPQSWPPVNGNWSSVYTVRNAWGKLWHQYLRRFFEVANHNLLSLLHIKRGTTLSKYFQIYMAFFLSALFHHVGALNIPYFETVSYQFLFFVLQPVCITIEDVAIALGKRAGVKDSSVTRALGYLWTFTAVTFTGRYIAVFFSECGAMLAPNPRPFRFWDRVMPLLRPPGYVGTSFQMKAQYQ